MTGDDADIGQLLITIGAEELRAGLRKHKSEGISVTLQSLKDHATLLLGHCAHRGWTVPPQLALLIAELLDDSKCELSPLSTRYETGDVSTLPTVDVESSTSASEREKDVSDLKKAMSKAEYRLLLSFAGINEVGIRNLNKAIDVEAEYSADPTLRNPSTAPVSRVAELSGATRHTIRRWRNEFLYRNSVEVRRGRKSEKPTK